MVEKGGGGVVVVVDVGWACWSVSAKISECINMPRRQAEYNPSYIQSSSWDHRAKRRKEDKGTRKEVDQVDGGPRRTAEIPT